MNKTINELLAEQNENYQNAEIPEVSFGIIEEGDYDALLIKAVIQAVKATQYRDSYIFLRWEAKITSDKHHNRYLTTGSDLQGDNIKWTKLYIKNCGVQMDALTELPGILESRKLENLPINITVKIYENKNGQKKNSFWINNLIKAHDPTAFNQAIDTLPVSETIDNLPEPEKLPDTF